MGVLILGAISFLVWYFFIRKSNPPGPPGPDPPDPGHLCPTGQRLYNGKCIADCTDGKEPCGAGCLDPKTEYCVYGDICEIDRLCSGKTSCCKKDQKCSVHSNQCVPCEKGDIIIDGNCYDSTWHPNGKTDVETSCVQIKNDGTGTDAKLECLNKLCVVPNKCCAVGWTYSNIDGKCYADEVPSGWGDRMIRCSPILKACMCQQSSPKGMCGPVYRASCYGGDINSSSANCGNNAADGGGPPANSALPHCACNSIFKTWHNYGVGNWSEISYPYGQQSFGCTPGAGSEKCV